MTPEQYEHILRTLTLTGVGVFVYGTGIFLAIIFKDEIKEWMK